MKKEREGDGGKASEKNVHSITATINISSIQQLMNIIIHV